MLQGFKDFIMRGNLIELAVAFIMASTFAVVVTEFTAVVLGFIGKAGGQPDFKSASIADVNVGLFINSVITFLIVAMVVYFFIVVPYNRLQERRAEGKEPAPTAPAEDVLLLQEIRDLLRAQQTR